jgi:hypothetical protein
MIKKDLMLGDSIALHKERPMTRVTVTELVSDALNQFTEPVELCDPSGRTLGRFVPVGSFQLKESDQCPYSADELDRARNATGGRPLAEIWKDLGRS